MEELKRKLAEALGKASAVADTADKDAREFTAEEQNQIKGWLEEARGFKALLLKKSDDDEIRRAITDLGADLAGHKNGRIEPVPAGKGETLGERFIRSPEFKGWLDRVAPGGHIPESSKGLQSPPVQFKTLITGLGETSAGAMVFNDVLPDIVGALRRPLTLLDVVTKGSTESDTVEDVQVDVETNAAAPVAEATATGGASGTKPESAMTFKKVTYPVRTIAHWVPATKRALSDAGQLRTLIDNFLRFGLEEELEDQMATGDGVGENLTGLSSISGVQVHAIGADTAIVAYRKARTKVRTVGRDTPNAYLLHPLDWEQIDLLQDNEARYYMGGPRDLGQPRMWSLPVIETEAIPEGTAYVGNFKQCVLWDREQASVQVSDSHSDFFVRNMIAILAEMRAAFGCRRPKSLVKITGI